MHQHAVARDAAFKLLRAIDRSPGSRRVRVKRLTRAVSSTVRIRVVGRLDSSLAAELDLRPIAPSAYGRGLTRFEAYLKELHSLSTLHFEIHPLRGAKLGDVLDHIEGRRDASSVDTSNRITWLQADLFGRAIRMDIRNRDLALTGINDIDTDRSASLVLAGRSLVVPVCPTGTRGRLTSWFRRTE